ncbi:ABC transporter ATP-binding protein [Desulfurivibrio alkaliphilus]|uniref:ABC transporter related protein n=1 Tax=Desulfurivibrio alkaliphilus (strain DSM 19089 / UNIQEM U267 / AHT2) TaxID=589865 RepID=D6Z6C6_DESAT|nr:ABC transporter ATP-binding protein [Desulfurivibrio alkaliphilus]ADH86891.1 ABC transporter related protein [Desulfurivibrio alkaliphilus AHT 2]
MQLEVKNVHISYGGPDIVKGVDLQLGGGAIGCLLGPSGCGKTTLLRAIAGFEPVRQGKIRLGEKLVSSHCHFLPPEKRRVGMVFQDLALFPHLSVADNIAFGLRGVDAKSRRRRVAELLVLIGLEECGPLFPHQLSGGQQQRVALARAMAPRPELLLLDEPFSSLDMEIREKLAREVGKILKQEELTALLVTHDQFEAFAMADEIGVLYDGRLQQWDTAYNLYHRPKTRFVADFIGEGVLLPGEVKADGKVETGLGLLQGIGSGTEEKMAPGSRVSVLVRPEDVIHDDASPVKAEVLRRDFRGANILYTLRLNSGHPVQALVPSHCSHATGEMIGIHADVRHLVLFPE